MSWNSPLVTLQLLIAVCINAEPVEIRINEGWLRGEHRPLSTGLGTMYSFKGIPFAEPPVGKLRFKDPLPHKGWEGVKNATEHGAICLQFKESMIGSEDCLFVNVYTPTLKPEKPLPVIFFTFPGSWLNGHGNEDKYGADFLVTYDVIVVTCNHRLDALGFLTLDTKSVPGNAGMKDQVLALKWIQNNIQYFGGDPKEVTILGQSSGAASVIYNMMSPMTQGLFNRVISMSDVPLADFALPFQAVTRCFILGKDLGKDTHDAEELLEFLQELPAEKLINQRPAVISQENLWEPFPHMMNYFVPVPEKDFGQERYLDDSTIEILKKGKVRDVDLLIGNVNKEFMYALVDLEQYMDIYNKYRELLIPREILMKIPPENILPLGEKIYKRYFGDQPLTLQSIGQYIKYADESSYSYDAQRFLKYFLPNRHSKTFYYKFYIESKRNSFFDIGLKYGIRGCGHEDDLRYLFDDKNDPTFPVDIHSREYKLINQTCTLFTNFVKYGNPTPDSSFGIKWVPYDNITRTYMNIDEVLTIDNNPDSEAVSWWHDVFKENGIELP